MPETPSTQPESRDNTDPAVQETLRRQSVQFARQALSLRRQQRYAGRLAMASGIGIFVFFAVSGARPDLLNQRIIEPCFLGLFCLAGFGLLWALATGSLLEEQVQQAKATRDKRKIGVLLDAYRDSMKIANMPMRDPKRPNTMLHHADGLAEFMSDILPGITEEDSIYLSPSHKGILHQLLRHRNEKVALSSLTALSEIGDRLDERSLLKILEPHWRDNPEPAVLAAIPAAVTQIHNRLERNKQNAALLRAAQRPTAAAEEILVRPASAYKTEDDAEVLLRAGHE